MRIVVIALMSSLVAGCAAMTDRQRTDEAAVAAAVSVGEPVDCIETTLIRDSRARGDSVIDFHLRNGRVYRNSLPSACPGLGFNSGFAYRIATTRLCSVDLITVRNGGGTLPGPTCALGRFQEIRTAAR